MNDMIAAIKSACDAVGMSQRQLAAKTNISQATFNRILSGARPAKMPEIILIAEATGCTTVQLTGSAVADRVQCRARLTDGSTMDAMRQQLIHCMELDAYLEDQAIAEV